MSSLGSISAANTSGSSCLIAPRMERSPLRSNATSGETASAASVLGTTSLFRLRPGMVATGLLHECPARGVMCEH